GIAAVGERARRVAEPLDVEARHLFAETAGPEQHILGGNAAVGKMQLAPFLAAHEGRRLSDSEARRAALDQHRADAVEARAVTQIDQKNLRLGAKGGKHLAAV